MDSGEHYVSKYYQLICLIFKTAYYLAKSNLRFQLLLYAKHIVPNGYYLSAVFPLYRPRGESHDAKESEVSLNAHNALVKSTNWEKAESMLFEFMPIL